MPISGVRRLALTCVLLAVAAIVSSPARPQSDAELTGLNSKVLELYRTGKYAEAIPLAQRYAEVMKVRHGPDHPEYATANNNLAGLYERQGRYAEAEPLYKRTLSIFEKALGPDHPSVGTSLNNLAGLYRAQGRYAEAEPLYKRSLAIREKALGLDHPSVGTSLNNLAALYESQGRYAEAEPLYKRSLAILEKALGPDHPDVGELLNNLAGLYETQGRYAEAEPLYKRTVSIFEKALGPDHPSVGTSLNNLAGLYRAQGRYAEAEPLYKRTLSIFEKALEPDHPLVGTSLNNLAALYRGQGRYAEAEPLYKRSLAIREKALGPDHPDVGTSLNLAGLYESQGRYAEAEPLYKRSLAIREKALGSDHPSVGTSLNNLAGLYRAQGRYAEAEPLHKRTVSIFERALGPDHPLVGTSLNSLAGLYDSQGRYAEAEQLYKRSLAVREKGLGPDHPDVGTSLNNLAGLYFVQRDWARAAEFWRRSTSVIVRRAQRGTADVGQALTGKRKAEPEQASWQFWGLVKAAHRLASAAHSAVESLQSEMFKTAQWARASEAAASLAQMSARQAKGDSALARLARERQDLVGEWQTRDKMLIAAKSQSADKRNAAAEMALAARLATIDARITEIDRALAKDFPDYAALANPEPLSIGGAQAMLDADEALLLFLDTPEWQPTPDESFIWIVTKAGFRSVRSELGTKALTESVAALRCGLDQASWEGEGASRCAGLLKTNYSSDDARIGKPLPFDLARAHELYRALFGQVEDLIKNKHLLIVPSGPLTSLPFQVLVTEPSAAMSDAGGYANASWLTNRHAISVLPSVASIKALRQFAKTSKATEPFIGFGNPLLTGPEGKDRRAWDRQSCKGFAPSVQVASRRLRSALPKFFRSGLADVEEVRAQTPLPETADELCAVARSSGTGDDQVYLGESATETKIKALSADGTLARARVVHFATHGLLAGETEMLAASKAEPALILTPPAQASEDDDGLLTASEIAQLKLDADWVVLSACNTAAGESDKLGAEALSGLARAFFYAGARALLVSHWAVNSAATVHLITKAFDELKTDPKIGRAEALRRSMLALIKKGGGYAHPANWAPFVVVGEGAK